MSVNDKEIPILVIYYSKSRILHQQVFGSFSAFGDLLNFFNGNIKNNEIKLKKKYFINNKEIKNSDLLIKLIQQTNISDKIKSINFLIEIEEINNIGDENLPIFKKILQPSRDKFGLYVFFPEKGTISLEEYPKNIENEFELNKFNINSAYCNSPNSLFISGGKFNERKINNFWIINNEFYSIQKLNMIFPKSNHSMLYININKKEIIFLAGGDDLKTFYYDIKNNIFVEWGDMNDFHFRPGLINIGDYLFCIHLLKDENNKIYFEKTNLNNKNHIWEKIYPNFESEDLINNIINNEFSVSHCERGNIMLIGGNLNNSNSYLYNLNKNLFSINNNCKNVIIPLIDRTFYKINESHNIALPYNLSNYVEIAIFNKKKYTLRKIHLKPISGNKKIKYKNYLKQDLNFGKVIVEFKTEEFKKEYDINRIIKNNKIIQNEKLVINNNSYNKINNNSYNQNEIKNKNQSNINKQNNSQKKNNNIFGKELLPKENIISNKIDELELKNLNKVNFGIDNNEESIENNNNENINDLKISNNIQYDNNIDIGNNIGNKNNKISCQISQDKNNFEDINQNLYINNKEEEIEEKNVDNNPNINNNEQNISISEEVYEDAINENMAEHNEKGRRENEFEELNDENINEFNENQMEEENEEMELNGEENEEMELNGEENEENEINGEDENEINLEEENEEENDGPIERDRFEMTIAQNIGEDIIQIENFPEFYFEENNFCDYDLRQEE